MSMIGRTLVIFGVVLIIIGIALSYLNKFPSVGRLPGDVVWKKENFTFYFPLGTSIIVSLILTAILYLIGKFR